MSISYLTVTFKMLMKDGPLPCLPDDLGNCVECVMEKLTITKKNGSIHSQNLLKIIYTMVVFSKFYFE